MRIFQKIKNFFKPKISTLNTIFIDEKKICKNLETIQNLQKNSQIFPVLKSNAYWHGIIQMLEIFKKNKKNFDYIAVDSLPEYDIIAKNSKYKILLLSETLHENYQFFDFKRTTFVVYNLETLEFLKNLNKKIKIHLFLNTGMNREWIQEKNLEKFLKILKHQKNIELEWILSHFHSADDNNNSIEEQVQIFKKFFEKIQKYWLNPKYRHIGASSWIIKLEDNFFNSYRAGIILYWYNPTNEKLDISPALSLESTIIWIQNITKNEWVSYNHKWKSIFPSTIATIPFGYFEGLDRKMSGKIFYKFNQKFYEQVGNICMNISSVLGDKNMKIGDKIEIISDDENDKNSIKNLAKINSTIEYEILVKLDKNIRRVVR